MNEMWISIRGCLKSLMQKHIPLKKTKMKIDPPWMDGDIRRSIDEKGKAWKKWKDSKKEKDRDNYEKKVSETKKKIRNKKNAHERKIAQCRKSNPKMFYAFIKGRGRVGVKLGR